MCAEGPGAGFSGENMGAGGGAVRHEQGWKDKSDLPGREGWPGFQTGGVTQWRVWRDRSSWLTPRACQREVSSDGHEAGAGPQSCL